MISLIEALNFRCLKNIRQPLNRFHLLVGANASGKTTFLDVVSFLRDLAADGVQSAVGLRTSNFYDLIWQHGDTGFELAVELELPPELCDPRLGESHDRIRYEVRICLDCATNQIEIPAEQAFVKSRATSPTEVRRMRDTLFERTGLASDDHLVSDCLFAKYDGRNSQPGCHLRLEGNSPVSHFNYRIRKQQSLLTSLPGYGPVHPISLWLREELIRRAMGISLDQKALRFPAPVGVGKGIGRTEVGLPWTIARFAEESPRRFTEWIAHLQIALPELADVTTTERPEDRHRYISLAYRGGLTVPSWMASDGSLRLLALTLPAYLEDTSFTYLVEEPENGLHPLAIETVYQSLSGAYDSQVLVATHSPVLLSVAKPQEVLCFSKTADGATEIVSGDRHRNMQYWRGEVDLGTLFASGVLG